LLRAGRSTDVAPDNVAVPVKVGDTEPTFNKSVLLNETPPNLTRSREGRRTDVAFDNVATPVPNVSPVDVITPFTSNAVVGRPVLIPTFPRPSTSSAVFEVLYKNSETFLVADVCATIRDVAVPALIISIWSVRIVSVSITVVCPINVKLVALTIPFTFRLLPIETTPVKEGAAKFAFDARVLLNETPPN